MTSAPDPEHSLVVLVNTLEGLEACVAALANYSVVAVDGEGVGLSRSGPLTLLALRGISRRGEAHGGGSGGAGGGGGGSCAPSASYL